jgi:hypothetical protein
MEQSVIRWERATPMALFLSITHPLSAIVGGGYSA